MPTWVGAKIHAKVKTTPSLVDTGQRYKCPTEALRLQDTTLTVQLANGTIEKMPYGIRKGIVWVKGRSSLARKR